MAQGDPKDEYHNASENIRHFQTSRFTLLTVYIAISAGTLTVLSATIATSTGTLTFLLKLAGLLSTLLFWILNERNMACWHHFVQRATELESVLGYQLYSSMPKTSIFSSTVALRLLYPVLALFWIAAFLWVP